MFPVLDFVLPAREISRMRRQPSPTVAWHALDDETWSFPFAVVLFLVLAILLLQLHRYAAPFSKLRLPVWATDPLGTKRTAGRIKQMNDRQRTTAEKFAKVVYRYRSLQSQLKARDDQLHRQSLELSTAVSTLDELHAANAQLHADNRRLAAEKTVLEQRAREQYYEHARQLREREGLQRVVGLLEADKAVAKETYDHLDRAHENLKLQMRDLEDALAAQRETGVHAEAALEEAVRCNEHLLLQLHEQGRLDDQERLNEEQGRLVEERVAEYETALEQAHRDNEVLREQLARQHELHVLQQQEWAGKLEEVKADRREMKAKLKKAQTDIQLKASDISRLEAQAEQYKHQLEEQCNSFREDLTFVHNESKCAQDTHDDQLRTAHAESATLRHELTTYIQRYEDQAARLRAAQAGLRNSACDHTQLELKLKAAEAEKQAADSLEGLLHTALRREQDKYETLEISFDVLEGAYAFLARELVRTEHALAAARAQQTQPTHSQLFEHRLAHARLSRASSPADTESFSEEEEERGWPATPGLSRSFRSTTTSVSSPVLSTPPLPALCLEPIASSDSGATKRALEPADPEDIFGAWSPLEGLPLISPT